MFLRNYDSAACFTQERWSDRGEQNPGGLKRESKIKDTGNHPNFKLLIKYKGDLTAQ